MKIKLVDTYPDAYEQLASKQADIVILESESPRYSHDDDTNYGKPAIWSHVMFRQEDDQTATVHALAQLKASEAFGDARKRQLRCFLVYRSQAAVLDALESLADASKGETSPI